jgi:hypothetical protein
MLRPQPTPPRRQVVQMVILAPCRHTIPPERKSARRFPVGAIIDDVYLLACR